MGDYVIRGGVPYINVRCATKLDIQRTDHAVYQLDIGTCVLNVRGRIVLGEDKSL
jgi:hypothetical protein